ncbi:hypothetical protein WJX84_003397 [Apatococcus fuscideae]|uniref:Uncharacterized protein n=1 Tax=Apatococcus fuscideae TaxID=2026836 RepID=A0AAW1TKH5_9CHLO
MSDREASEPRETRENGRDADRSPSPSPKRDSGRSVSKSRSPRRSVSRSVSRERRPRERSRSRRRRSSSDSRSRSPARSRGRRDRERSRSRGRYRSYSRSRSRDRRRSYRDDDRRDSRRDYGRSDWRPGSGVGGPASSGVGLVGCLQHGNGATVTGPAEAAKRTILPAVDAASLVEPTSPQGPSARWQAAQAAHPPSVLPAWACDPWEAAAAGGAHRASSLATGPAARANPTTLPVAQHATAVKQPSDCQEGPACGTA